MNLQANSGLYEAGDFSAHREGRVVGALPVIAGVRDLRAWLTARPGKSIGLVPTMGALHAGHLALLREARANNDLAAISIFVNPAQFRPGEDLDKYPRPLANDLELAREAGADVVFAPEPGEIYPDGFATAVTVGGITSKLCGDPDRRGPKHFAGVTTVVAKLFNIVGPTRAYFGQKDAQQVAVIKRMVADLNMPVEIVVCPTIRERGGLALSSRNAYLSASEREAALSIPAGLLAAATSVAGGERSAGKILDQAREHLSKANLRIEYIELVDSSTLEPIEQLQRPALLALAAYSGATRLIDNVVLDPDAGQLPVL